ncbi:MAG: glycerate kinase [Peptococcaceae bacterium]|nr:glycerate kinase [Peptococcaceae bacterium]
MGTKPESVQTANDASGWQIVIAPDSFKGSLSALEAAEAMQAGVLKAFPGAQTRLFPIADGGEGTVDAVLRALGGQKVPLSVTGPLGAPVEAFFGILPDGKTAVLEMASASGLPLLLPQERDPRLTTTYGTGELIRAAIEAGAGRIILGIGGSATNDGGAGMAQALGIRLLDVRGVELPRGGAALTRLARIDLSERYPGLAGVEIIAACDVENPLTGPQGASLVYGPQKGASPAVALELDAALANLAEVMQQDLEQTVNDIPGAGAAGGLGAGLIAFLGAKLQPGFTLLAESLHLEDQIAQADLVITGEGALDTQTAFGKVPSGIACLAQRYGVPVVAIGGSLGPGAEALYALGIAGIVPATCRPMELAEAMRDAGNLVTLATRNAMELIKLGHTITS